MGLAFLSRALEGFPRTSCTGLPSPPCPATKAEPPRQPPSPLPGSGHRQGTDALAQFPPASMHHFGEGAAPFPGATIHQSHGAAWSTVPTHTEHSLRAGPACPKPPSTRTSSSSSPAGRPQVLAGLGSWCGAHPAAGGHRRTAKGGKSGAASSPAPRGVGAAVPTLQHHFN